MLTFANEKNKQTDIYLQDRLSGTSSCRSCTGVSVVGGWFHVKHSSKYNIPQCPQTSGPHSSSRRLETALEACCGGKALCLAESKIVKVCQGTIRSPVIINMADNK